LQSPKRNPGFGAQSACGKNQGLLAASLFGCDGPWLGQYPDGKWSAKAWKIPLIGYIWARSIYIME